MRRKVPLTAWAFVLLLSSTASAQHGALGELYGNGVHAYNHGDYVEAFNLLTRAIDSGSKDPRCYYFRGLSYMKLGREREARAEFTKGAELEMSDADRFYNVSKSLERIQGRARSLIEKARSEARLLAYENLRQERYERYERIRANEPNILQKPRRGAKPAPDDAEKPAPGDGEPEGPAPKPSAPSKPEPFADDAPIGQAADEAMPEKEATETEPADEKTAEEPAEEMPAEEKPAEEAEEKPAAESDDPFAEDGAKAKDKDAADNEEMDEKKVEDDSEADQKDTKPGDKKDAKAKEDDDPFAE